MLNANPTAPLKLAAKQPRRRSVISLTPLIDVVFILLVFFMLASSFLDWRSIELNATPAASAPAQRDSEPPLLSVSQTELKLDGEVTTLEQAIPQLQAQLRRHPEHVVRIQPLADTPLQPVVSVLDGLSEAGITQLTLIRDADWEDPAAHPR